MNFLTVTIDRSGCISCGICESTCPEVFAIASDGLAEVIAQPDENQAADAKQAAEDCPVDVIKVEE